MISDTRSPRRARLLACVQLAIVWPTCGYSQELIGHDLKCKSQPDPRIVALCERIEPTLKRISNFHRMYICDYKSAQMVFCERPLTKYEADAIDRYLEAGQVGDGRLTECLVRIRQGYAYQTTPDQVEAWFQIECG